MKKYIVLSLIISLYACSEKEIRPYEDKSMLAFGKSLIDTTYQSFFFFVEDEIEHPVEVLLIGPVPTKDLNFSIVIDEKVTDCPKSLYTMPKSYTFDKGQIIDTFYIKLKKSPEMVDKTYTIAFEVNDSEDLFYPGRLWGRNIITISDKAERPEWWTLSFDTDGEPVRNSIESIYLGKYSRKKYEHFILATGVSNLTDMSSGEIRNLSIKFKRYLKAQDPKIFDEDNNQEMTVTVVGD